MSIINTAEKFDPKYLIESFIFFGLAHYELHKVYSIRCKLSSCVLDFFPPELENICFLKCKLNFSLLAFIQEAGSFGMDQKDMIPLEICLVILEAELQGDNKYDDKLTKEIIRFYISFGIWKLEQRFICENQELKFSNLNHSPACEFYQRFGPNWN